MSGRKQKLELTWIGKENRPKLEPRILLEDPEKSYHAPHRVTDHDLFDNRIIFGDNLLALKALEQEFTGKIKCIFIDPPYNTGSAFEHYDDGVEHSIWLSLMRDRLQLLRQLMSSDGSLEFWNFRQDFRGQYTALTKGLAVGPKFRRNGVGRGQATFLPSTSSGSEMRASQNPTIFPIPMSLPRKWSPTSKPPSNNSARSPLTWAESASKLKRND